MSRLCCMRSIIECPMAFLMLHGLLVLSVFIRWSFTIILMDFSWFGGWRILTTKVIFHGELTIAVWSCVVNNSCAVIGNSCWKVIIRHLFPFIIVFLFFFFERYQFLVRIESMLTLKSEMICFVKKCICFCMSEIILLCLHW